MRTRALIRALAMVLRLAFPATLAGAEPVDVLAEPSAVVTCESPRDRIPSRAVAMAA